MICGMYDPPHPGEELREDMLPGMGWSVSEAARRIGLRERTLREILEEKRGISWRTARLLEKSVGSTASCWRALQEGYDAWHAQSPTERRVRERARNMWIATQRKRKAPASCRCAAFSDVASRLL